MLQDLHAHTYYSFDCKDTPQKVIETAIANGVTLLGICDHNHGVGLGAPQRCYGVGTNLNTDYGDSLNRYFDHITLLKEKYEKKIKILRGIEAATCVGKDNYALPNHADISFFDFCLVEGLDKTETSIAKGDIFTFAKRCGCPTGIAHTDLFAFLQKQGFEPNAFFRKMAQQGIFWELNVNLDSSHAYKTHDYVTEFFKNKTQQQIVKSSGVKLSIGFDSHAIKEYKPSRLQTAHNLIKTMGIPLMFEHL